MGYQKRKNFSYKNRKVRVRNSRRETIFSINASIRHYTNQKLSYSRAISILSDSNIGLNRPILADLAINEGTSFRSLICLILPERVNK